MPYLFSSILPGIKTYVILRHQNQNQSFTLYRTRYLFVVSVIRVGFNIVYGILYEQCEYIYPVDCVETYLYNDPHCSRLLAAAW